MLMKFVINSLPTRNIKFFHIHVYIYIYGIGGVLMVHVFKIFGGLTSFSAALARVESKILIKHDKHTWSKKNKQSFNNVDKCFESHLNKSRNYIEWALLNNKFECSRYIHPQLHWTKHVRSRIGSVTIYMITVTFLKRM